VRQIIDFLSFTAGMVVTIVGSLYQSIAGLLPASLWIGVAALVVVLVLYSRLSSRIEDVEMTLVQLDAKLDTILSRLARPRDGNPSDRSRR